jgi:dipeptidyl aminopeptidase/acylaminoacyl peptidase
MRTKLALLCILSGVAHAQAPSLSLLPLSPARHIDIDTTQGTWLSPDLSPDGETIVFELLGDLYRIPARGGDARALTQGMAFDSQPVFSPDGRDLAFISDRSGAENLWIIRADGTDPRQLTRQDDNAVFTSPVWSADGKTIWVSRFEASRAAFSLWRYDVRDGAGVEVIPVKKRQDVPRDEWSSVLGAFPSADGKFLYFARHIGETDPEHLPEWSIVRRNLENGRDEVLVSAPRSPRPDLLLGTAFRPAVSHDGRLLIYGARDRGLTGLRLLNLETHADRWLKYPIQQDETQASGWRDLLPRHIFSRDDKALILNFNGRLARVDIASGDETEIPFRVRQRIEIGPSTRQSIHQEQGPVRARVIQNPVQSPDGRFAAFSSLGTIYTQRLTPGALPRRVAAGFQPSWSPDGKRLLFVSWNARDAGQVWIVSAGGGTPLRVSDIPAYYTSPQFTPDGRRIVALRSSNSVRMHSYMEYGALRQCELVYWPISTGLEGEPIPATVFATGPMGGTPHFAGDSSETLVLFGNGLHAVRLDGSGDRLVANVTGPNWYFAEGRAQADDMRLSPDKQWLLVQIAQQLYVLKTPAVGTTVDIADANLSARRLTDIGADYFGWADGGRTITWALGSTFYRRSLNSPLSAPSNEFEARVELPRKVVRGSLLFRGATVITEVGDQVIPDADLLIVDDRVAGVGPRGTLAVPAGTKVVPVPGRWIVPGFIDTHDHIADIRRGILDFDSWGPLSNLAYGVTLAFDPSPLSIDMLSYQDAIDAGLMVGSRITQTGPAIFSFNEFESYAQVRAVVSRYRDAYRVGNIKMYRSGNRRVRQWIAMAAREIGLQPTTEGALSMKLDMTQIMDGYAGNEHALTAVPLYQDMLDLVAKSGVEWTATLQITNGGPEGQDYFIVRDHPADDPKLNRFMPRFVVDMKTRTRTYRELEEYSFPRVAASTAAVQRAGGLIGIGSHGEMPGIGFQWEMQAHVMGGMTPAEALHAGTIGSAAAIGREQEFGSIERGKFADLVILERDPLLDIRNALAIDAVVLGGRVRDGRTMDERWPVPHALPRRWYCDDRPPGTVDSCPMSGAVK